MLRIQNFIGGKFLDPLAGKWLDNIEPATGKVYGYVPDSDSSDIDAAVVAATNAFKSWSKTPTEERSKLLNKVADLLEKNSDEFAKAESVDTGKPFSLAKAMDISRAVANFRFFAGSVLHHEDMSTVMDNGSINYVVSQPVGVAGLISPWNLPLYLLTWKIAPAISVGNTCVCKPSEITSVTAWMLCKLFVEAGFPDGVVNMVFGLGSKAGQALVEHPNVPLISFTGGTLTARNILKSSAALIKRFSLELGGKNPNIIYDDTDLDKCIPTTVRSSFLNQGEICLCGSRIFVQEKIYDSFIKRFEDEVRKWVVGDPNDPTTNVGALISQQHMEKVLSFIQLAKESGGNILCGGSRISPSSDRCAGGYFFQPTIITGLSNKSRVCQEEIFGPVVTVVKFSTEEEVIEMANDVMYGLSASVWTTDIGRAQRTALALKVGTVWINCWLNRDLRVPFGGQKMSGIGREGGKFSWEFFTERKTVCIKL